MPATFLLAATGSIGVEVLATLAVAAFVALLAQRLRLSAAPAFLLAGAAAGPHALGIVSSPENLTEIGHIATMLLLFGIGLEMRISRDGRVHDSLRLIGAGVAACIGCTLVGWPIATLFGLGLNAALAVSMAMALSSTALVLRALSVKRELRRSHGRACLVVLIVQDLAVLAILAIIPLLAEREDEASFVKTVYSAAGSLAGVALLVILGKLFAARILRETARGPEGAQLMTIVAVVMAVGAGIATQRLGLSAELGAFLAGFLLADTPFRHQIAGAVSPMRDVLIAVFFTSIGMFVDPALALSKWWIVLIAGSVVAAVKGFVIGGSLWAFGVTARTAARSALTLAHGGEFSLVVLTAARAMDVIDEYTFVITVTVIVISLVVTPTLMSAAPRLAKMLDGFPAAPWIKSQDEDPGDGHLHGHVIIAGFGPVGRALAEQLDTAGAPYVLIDLNPDTVARQEKLGRRAFFGDAANAEVLESAGVHHAAALALTIPDDDAAVRACGVAVRLAPNLHIVARMSSLGQSNLARAAGAREVVVEEITAARAVRDAVMKHLTPPGEPEKS